MHRALLEVGFSINEFLHLKLINVIYEDRYGSVMFLTFFYMVKREAHPKYLELRCFVLL